MFLLLASAVRPDLHVRPVCRQPAPGLGDLRRDGGHPGRRGRSSRCTARPPATRSSRPASTRPLGNMEGKEVRFGSAVGGLFAAVTTGTSTGAINSWHDSFQPDRRPRPAVQHRARRDHAGRHRRRPVRDARHRRHPGGLHRRPDGRPDARVPGQEGRELRDEDGHAGRPRPGGASILGFTALATVLARRAGRAAERRARTASARSSTPSRARPATTARPSPA